MDSKQRAKLILDICAYEFEYVPIWARANVEEAIAHQIDEAIKDHMIKINRKIIDTAREVKESHNQSELISSKVRRKRTH